MPKSQVREHHLEEQECPSSWWESSQEQNCYSWGQIWIKSVGRWGPGSSLCHTHFLKNSFWWKMRLPGWSLKTLLPHSFPLCGFLPSALWLWRWERALSWGLGTSTMHNPSARSHELTVSKTKEHFHHLCWWFLQSSAFWKPSYKTLALLKITDLMSSHTGLHQGFPCGSKDI